MSGSTIVAVDVAVTLPVKTIEIQTDGGHLDVTSPSAPFVEVDLPDPQPPPVIDVTLVPPVVTVDAAVAPGPASVDVQSPLPILVDVIATPPTPVRVDAIAAWQTGIEDVNLDGIIYGRLNRQWVGALSLLAPYAPLNSPTLVGVPTTPTPPTNANSTQIANAQFVQAAVVAGHKDDIVQSVARKIGDVLLYTADLEDWNVQILDGGSF
jgi:hypothetical protein